MKTQRHKYPVQGIILSALAFIVIFLIGSGFSGGDVTSDMEYDMNSDVSQEWAANHDSAISSNRSEPPDDNRGGSMPLYGEWKTFTKEDGLPSNKINTVKIDNGRILAGTDRGMAVFENDEWTVYTPEDGLAHRNVLSIDVDEMSGDVWIGTMNGLSRWSAGEFKRFDQFNSGLANDVVYEVVCDGQYVWIATAAGANRYDTYTNQWIIFNEETSPMHEPWTYGITKGENKAYIAAWGGGVVEYNNDTGDFRVYRDPDGQFQLTMYPDDGLIHDITTGTAFDDGILWVSTYFGMSRYDGQRWWGYLEHDSPLTSNFINAVKARNSVAYFATDDGLNTFNGTTWVVYNPIDGSENGETTITRGTAIQKINTSSSVAHGFIWNMDANDDELWVATSNGLSTAKIVGYADEYIQ